MSKKILNLEFEVDFQLLGIVSNLRDYRLCWFLNQNLDLDFTRTEDLKAFDRQSRMTNDFSLFEYQDELNKTEYYLISNLQGGNHLLKELKQINFLFKLCGAYSQFQLEDLLSKINKLPQVQTCFRLEPEDLKEKEKLFF